MINWVFQNLDKIKKKEEEKDEREEERKTSNRKVSWGRKEIKNSNQEVTILERVKKISQFIVMREHDTFKQQKVPVSLDSMSYRIKTILEISWEIC